MPADRPTVILLTPVKNEAWILERFLRAASLWADHVVLADQQSTDATREIAARFPKVTVVDNDSGRYDEAARQRLLLAAARNLPAAGGPDARRVLLALDADEFLAADFADQPGWHEILAAPPGTVVRLDRVNVAPGATTGWVADPGYLFGFVDDGSDHGGETIHSARLPTPEGAPVLHPDGLKVLHLQFVDWPRMKSKQRWYQCWERLEHPAKRPVTLFRQYNYMDADLGRATPLPAAWTARYDAEGIALGATDGAPFHHWDRDVLGWMATHGPDRFRRLAVWDVDWNRVNAVAGVAPGRRFDDPRTPFERRVLAWLARTQPHADRLPVRIAQKLLHPLGW